MDSKYNQVDLDGAINRLHLDKAFLLKLIQKLLNGNMLNDAEEKFRSNDIEGARISIHSIKGTAANIGLSGLSQLALEIECKIKENQYLDFEMLELMKQVWEELKLKDF